MGIMVNEPEPDTYRKLINFGRLGGNKSRRYTDKPVSPAWRPAKAGPAPPASP
jgi:hypothetical protein